MSELLAEPSVNMAGAAIPESVLHLHNFLILLMH